MTLVSPPRLLLLVDTHLHEGGSTREERARVEHTIAMAGSLASHALEAGLMVGLCAFSEGWIDLKPNRGKRHGRDIMAALATLAPNRAQGAPPLLDHCDGLLTPSTTPVLLALLYVGNQIFRLTATPILLIGQFLVLLQIVKLFEQRANRDYASLLILSLLLVVAAAISTASLLFAMIMIAYLFLALYCCLLL